MTVRRLYAQLDAVERFGDPFSTEGAGSYFRWLTAQPRRGRGRTTPNRLWLFIHSQRSDLQRAFPHPLGIDRRRFLAWTRSHGAREHGVPPELL